MKIFGNTRRQIAAALLAISGLAAPSAAQSTDEAVQAALASGASARVIMQFDTTAARDAAFSRLLDRGAAVRTTDGEAGPGLVVLGSAATFAAEIAGARQTSIDATVTSASAQMPARAPRIRGSAAPHTFAPASTGPSIAVVDSGIQLHRDLPHVRYFKDFVGTSPTPVDGCGHGTHVAGIVAGDGRDSGGDYAGIAPGFGIVALRVLGDDCSGNTSDVIDALTWVANHHAEHQIKVVNVSLGHPVFESIFTDPFVQAVERLARKGILVVTAAGNQGINPATGRPGYGGVGVPCNAPSALCIGSLDTNDSAILGDDKVAKSSSRGPTRFDLLAKPDIVAPGVKIVSLSAPGSLLFNENPMLRVFGRTQPRTAAAYFTLSGTSMASPAAAGAAALVFKTNPALSANTVKMILQFTARDVAGADALTQGAGALNVNGAVTLAAAINPRTAEGRSWLRGTVSTTNVDGNGKRVKWAQRIIYGDRYLPGYYAGVHLVRWDDNVAWGYDAIDENVVWGNAADDNVVWGHGANVVWGNSARDNVVWGNSADENVVWGHNVVWGNNDVVLGYWAGKLTAGFWDENVVWGNVTRVDLDNVVWGNGAENVVWGNCSEGNRADENVVWGNLADDNVVWGNRADDNVVWGNCNVVWGINDENVVWGNAVLTSLGGGR